MKPLSRTANSFDRSPIRAMLDAAAAYPDAIHLELGQPDFATPPHIIEAAVNAARNEYTGYTANTGMPALRQAIITKLARENNLYVTPKNIIVTVGAMQAVYAAMGVLLDPGDSILIPDPGYGNFVMAASMFNAQSIRYPTLPEQEFVPDFAVLDTLVTPKTRALLVNSPSNPTGAVYDQATLRACLDFCCRHDLYMISDETYDQLVFEGRHFSPAQWDADGRVISIFTVSKTYSMTGWRVGYAVASEDIITVMSKIQEPIVSCVNTVAQHAAIAALEGCQDCAVEMRNNYRRRRDLAVEIAQRNGLQVSYPHGAFYMLIDISSQPCGSLPFAHGLLESEHVAVGPGCAFGELCDRYIRISLCASCEDLTEGITRIGRYLRRVSQPELCSARQA